MHVVVALFRRDWFVAAAMRAMREPPSVGARSIIARATALDNMRRCVVGVCARASRVCVCDDFRSAFLDFGFWTLDFGFGFGLRQRLARGVETDVERARERDAIHTDAWRIATRSVRASRRR